MNKAKIIIAIAIIVVFAGPVYSKVSTWTACREKNSFIKCVIVMNAQNTTNGYN